MVSANLPRIDATHSADIRDIAVAGARAADLGCVHDDDVADRCKPEGSMIDAPQLLDRARTGTALESPVGALQVSRILRLGSDIGIADRFASDGYLWPTPFSSPRRS